MPMPPSIDATLDWKTRLDWNWALFGIGERARGIGCGCGEVFAQHLVQRAALGLVPSALGACRLSLRVHPGQGLLGAPFGRR
jgi:hypothetical protein